MNSDLKTWILIRAGGNNVLCVKTKLWKQTIISYADFDAIFAKQFNTTGQMLNISLIIFYEDFGWKFFPI